MKSQDKKTHGLVLDMKSGIGSMVSSRQPTGNLTDDMVGLNILTMVNMHADI